jgi:hypothetical protein
MSCNQRLLLERLAVEDPTALNMPMWEAHLEECLECRRERYSFARSLAVFRQFEAQSPAPAVAGPSWERLTRELERDRRHRSRLRVRVPLAAASLLVAVGTGVLLWPVAQEPDLPPPARIVTLQPAERTQLQNVLDSSLQVPTRAQEAASHTTRAVAEQPPADFPLRGASAQPPTAQPVLDRSGFASPDAPRIVFGRSDGERAPVLLFRSLQQQRRGSQLPIEALPVFAPVHRDMGSLLPRALVAPLPIR